MDYQGEIIFGRGRKGSEGWGGEIREREEEEEDGGEGNSEQTGLCWIPACDFQESEDSKIFPSFDLKSNSCSFLKCL